MTASAWRWVEPDAFAVVGDAVDDDAGEGRDGVSAVVVSWVGHPSLFRQRRGVAGVVDQSGRRGWRQAQGAPPASAASAARCRQPGAQRGATGRPIAGRRNAMLFLGRASPPPPRPRRQPAAAAGRPCRASAAGLARGAGRRWPGGRRNAGRIGEQAARAPASAAPRPAMTLAVACSCGSRGRLSAVRPPVAVHHARGDVEQPRSDRPRTRNGRPRARRRAAGAGAMPAAINRARRSAAWRGGTLGASAHSISGRWRISVAGAWAAVRRQRGVRYDQPKDRWPRLRPPRSRARPAPSGRAGGAARQLDLEAHGDSALGGRRRRVVVEQIKPAAGARGGGGRYRRPSEFLEEWVGGAAYRGPSSSRTDVHPRAVICRRLPAGSSRSCAVGAWASNWRAARRGAAIHAEQRELTPWSREGRRRPSAWAVSGRARRRQPSRGYRREAVAGRGRRRTARRSRAAPGGLGRQGRPVLALERGREKRGQDLPVGQGNPGLELSFASRGAGQSKISPGRRGGTRPLPLWQGAGASCLALVPTAARNAIAPRIDQSRFSAVRRSTGSGGDRVRSSRCLLAR